MATEQDVSSSSDYRSITRVARAFATELGLQHKAVAEAIGLTEASFSNRMRGENRWQVHELKRLALLFGVPVDVFFMPTSEALAALERTRVVTVRFRKTAGHDPNLLGLAA